MGEIKDDYEIASSDLVLKYGYSTDTANRKIRKVKKAYGITNRKITFREYKKFYNLQD